MYTWHRAAFPRLPSPSHISDTLMGLMPQAPSSYSSWNHLAEYSGHPDSTNPGVYGFHPKKLQESVCCKFVV